MKKNVCYDVLVKVTRLRNGHARLTYKSGATREIGIACEAHWNMLRAQVNGAAATGLSISK